MSKVKHSYPRGAEWRQWDFHIHTPASFHWNGGKRHAQMSDDERTISIDQMINALNQAEPAVYVIMDYWTFDGWFALKKRLAEEGAPELKKKIFPGIELRLVSPTKHRLNAHVVFADDVTDQDLHNFMSKLNVALINQPLSNECLIRLAREKVGDDALAVHGFKPIEIASDDTKALLAGSSIAEIMPETYKNAIQQVPNGKAVGFMPWETNDGLSKADWKKHYAYVIGMMNASPIFETRRQELWAAFTGVETEDNKEWLKAFQAALDNIPRLAVSGSDAHSYADYGKFPADKITWIKADPTFLGLLQAIKEPAKRSFLGKCPDKIQEVVQNKTFYIDRIKVTKNTGSSVKDYWLTDCDIPLNTDLVAIIGNKGSGKSALADIIALLGNSRQKDHFSFLSSNRFRQKPKELAKHFTGTIQWCDQTTNDRLLSDNPPQESVELVKYIPQAHFEKLCNDHVSGQSDIFEKELRAVIFSHTNAAIRQKSLDFDQLIDQQERVYRDRLVEFRKDLSKINQEIESIEAQMQPDVIQKLNEHLSQIQKQIDEHKKIEPVIALKPSEQLTPEQQKATEELEKISEKLKEIESRNQKSLVKEATISSKTRAIQSIRERMHLLKRQYKQFNDDTAELFELLDLDAAKITSLSVNEDILNDLNLTLSSQKKSLMEIAEQDKVTRSDLQTSQELFNAKLNEPQQMYLNSLRLHDDWQAKLQALTGNIEEPETFEGLKERIAQIGQLPSKLEEKQNGRLSLCGEVFDALETQRKAREDLFQPVQELIQNNQLIRDEYKLQFQATLGGSIDALSSRLFALIKQNSGDFRGEEESYATIRKIAEQYDLNMKDELLAFVTSLYQRIIGAANPQSKSPIGIASILRSSKASGNKTAADVYDLLFGLTYLEPRYSLLFQDTQIEQLSPGQRGALLLIFYLLVDKGRNPIVLDQPEENLDNETVVSLLVPVLSEAKKKRQIIMVTHNPNLAVVCDAEEVIHSAFNRKNGCRIEYTSGSIENPKLNIHVVNVLEGTKPAFNNRRLKYH